MPGALLETAFRVFSERGYRAVRLEELAEAAGMTKGAIYYYFDSKEDLLRQALEHRHREIFAEIAESSQSARGPASAKIRFVLRKVWQHWMEPGWGHAFRLIFLRPFTTRKSSSELYFEVGIDDREDGFDLRRPREDLVYLLQVAPSARGPS